MADQDLTVIRVPWHQFPAMDAWRVVRKVKDETARHGYRYEPQAEKPRYVAYQKRKQAIDEAARLTQATGVPHITIRVQVVPCEKPAESEAHA